MFEQPADGGSGDSTRLEKSTGSETGRILKCAYSIVIFFVAIGRLYATATCGRTDVELHLAVFVRSSLSISSVS